MRVPHDNFESSVMTGLVEEVRNRGMPRISWIDNAIAWTVQSDQKRRTPYSCT